jgi:DNA-binding NtrC family response regulator
MMDAIRNGTGRPLLVDDADPMGLDAAARSIRSGGGEVLAATPALHDLAQVASLAEACEPGEGFRSLVGRSAAIRRVVALLLRAARTDVTVLLQGESGTGKEVAARAIHAEGTRRAGPFVAVNCGAIPETLIESELFGHERGAFTGATRAHTGRFEQADGGTIFLDEIGELRPDLQVRLLRVLQDRSVQRVGAAGTKRIDVRVIAASCRVLRDEVAAGAFREDLYYRLAVFPVEMPPLRERDDDILILAESFLRRYATRRCLPARGLSDEARRALLAYAWPGNVRELENVMELATILEDGPVISIESLPEEVRAPRPAPGRRPSGRAAPLWRRLVVAPPREAPPERRAELAAPASRDRDPAAALEQLERTAILEALRTTSWNIKRAASILGIGRATIYRKIDRYDLRAARPVPQSS